MADAKYIPYLDGWRGIAIILVLLNHFCGSSFYYAGRVGVNIFFVLSGLLMGRILFVDKTPLSIFYLRRAARIFPVFYLYIMVISLVYWCSGQEILQGDILYSSLFLRTYYPLPSIWEDNFPIRHLWSLNVEEHCYLLLSIIALFVAKRSEKSARYVVTGAAILSVVWYGYYKLFPPQSMSPFFLRSECAGFRIFISTSIYLWMRNIRATIPSWLPVISTLAGILLDISFDYGPLKFIICPMLLAIGVNTLHAAPDICLKVLSNRLLVWFGTCSFSIYIWQQPFYHMTLDKYGPYQYGIPLVLSLITASLSYYFFEKHARNYIRNMKPCVSRKPA